MLLWALQLQSRFIATYVKDQGLDWGKKIHTGMIFIYIYAQLYKSYPFLPYHWMLPFKRLPFRNGFQLYSQSPTLSGTQNRGFPEPYKAILGVVGFPCIGRIQTAYIRWGFLYSRHRKFLVTQACSFGGIMDHVPFSVPKTLLQHLPSSKLAPKKDIHPKSCLGNFVSKTKKNYRVQNYRVSKIEPHR